MYSGAAVSRRLGQSPSRVRICFVGRAFVPNAVRRFRYLLTCCGIAATGDSRSPVLGSVLRGGRLSPNAVRRFRGMYRSSVVAARNASLPRFWRPRPSRRRTFLCCNSCHFTRPRFLPIPVFFRLEFAVFPRFFRSWSAFCRSWLTLLVRICYDLTSLEDA